MLTGSAEIDEAAVATISTFNPDAVQLGDVHCLQVTIELRNSAREALLPPSLHPTVPPAISIQAWDVSTSPWGAFECVLVRVFCRSGVRARGYTLSAFSSTAASAAGLAANFGFPMQLAGVEFRHGYDGADLALSIEGKKALVLRGVNPEPMGLNDVQYTSTLNAAHTPNGFRLVQVEAHHVADKVDRLDAELALFDAASLGSPLMTPTRLVSASLCREQVEFPPVRFVCKVDELAFTGTEPVVVS